LFVLSEPQICATFVGQHLQVYENGKVTMDVMVEMAGKSGGNLSDNACSSRDRHTFRANIGENCSVNTVFIGNRQDGEIFFVQMLSN